MLILSFSGRDYPVYDSFDEFRRSANGSELYSEFKQIRKARPYRREHLAGLQVLVGKWIVSDDGKVTQCLGLASALLGNIIIQTPAGTFSTAQAMKLDVIQPSQVQSEASQMLAVLMMFAITKDLDAAIRLVLKHAPTGKDIERLLEFIHGNDVFLTHHSRIMELIGLNNALQVYGLDLNFALSIYKEIGESGNNKEKIMVADRVVALHGISFKNHTKEKSKGQLEDNPSNGKTQSIDKPEFEIVDEHKK